MRRPLVGLDGRRIRVSVVDEYKARRDPPPICLDMFVARPWMVEIRRASRTEVRRGMSRAERNPPTGNASGLEDTLGRGGEVPIDGTPPLSITPRSCRAGSRAGKVATEFLARIRLNFALHMQFRDFLGC